MKSSDVIPDINVLLGIYQTPDNKRFWIGPAFNEFDCYLNIQSRPYGTCGSTWSFMQLEFFPNVDSNKLDVQGSFTLEHLNIHTTSNQHMHIELKWNQMDMISLGGGTYHFKNSCRIVQTKLNMSGFEPRIQYLKTTVHTTQLPRRAIITLIFSGLLVCQN